MQLSTYLPDALSDPNETFSFTRQQGSDFAKGFAGDFNPIHDEESKRFCVPGDLLFSVLLTKKGIHQRMQFKFLDMVSDNVALSIHPCSATETQIIDTNGKIYLSMQKTGEHTQSTDLIKQLITQYVKFSAMNFPYILVPLMKAQNIMINCQRPLVIYDSMDIELENLSIKQPVIELSSSALVVEKRRGTVTLEFIFKEAGKIVGKGKKSMLLGGLQPYNQEEIDDLIERLANRKALYSHSA